MTQVWRSTRHLVEGRTADWHEATATWHMAAHMQISSIEGMSRNDMACSQLSLRGGGGVVQGPGGVANKQVKTNIDKETGKLTMLYEVWFHDKRSVFLACSGRLTTDKVIAPISLCCSLVVLYISLLVNCMPFSIFK